VETSEPVVLHHGREEDGAGHDDARPSASTALLGGLFRLVAWRSSEEIAKATTCRPKSL
jgi:hypothetical protein